MSAGTACRVVLLVAAAMMLPACGKRGKIGLPGPSAGSGITFDNTLSGMAATNIQDAIDELDFRVDLLEQVPADSVHEENLLFSYTVPVGMALVITHLRSSFASPFAIAGVKAGYGPIAPSKIVVNAGETVTAPNAGGSTPRMHGYLIAAARAPGTAVHFGNAAYTVPAGKTLYITHVASESVAGVQNVTIDGKLFIEAATRPEGETVFVPVLAGKTVSAIGSPGVHGYLK